ARDPRPRAQGPAARGGRRPGRPADLHRRSRRGAARPRRDARCERRLALRQRGAVLVVRVRRRDRARRGARRAVAPDPLGAAQPPGAPAGVLGARHRAARRRARPDPAPLARRAASLPRGRTHVSKILVTGGAGFIGSNFVRMLLQETAYEVVNLDALTYAG